MTTPHDRSPRHSSRMITFAAGGWVILLAALLSLSVLTWRLSAIWSGHGSRAVGDGSDAATYGFDLSTCQIPRDRIIGSGMPKDGLPVLVDPPVMPGDDVEAMNRQMHGKFLVPGDRVIGVSLGGETRAYPVRMLNWHEVVNDTIGGIPVVVTYSPLCDSAVVFDRRVGGEALVFGFSGLLYNSNLLMYDRRPEASDESLWSQLLCRAVTGPAAASERSLRVLASSLVRWADWRELHPETEVLRPDPVKLDRYKRDPYISYYGSDELRFPVDPLPPIDGMPRKTPVVVVGINGQRRVFTLPAIAGAVDAEGRWQTDVGGAEVQFVYRDSPPTVYVHCPTPGVQLETIHAFWFAWYAMDARED